MCAFFAVSSLFSSFVFFVYIFRLIFYKLNWGIRRRRNAFLASELYVALDYANAFEISKLHTPELHI